MAESRDCPAPLPRQGHLGGLSRGQVELDERWARSKRPGDMQKAYVQACVHMEFVAKVYLDQLAEGRYFLHEHPNFATSW